MDVSRIIQVISAEGHYEDLRKVFSIISAITTSSIVHNLTASSKRLALCWRFQPHRNSLLRMFQFGLVDVLGCVGFITCYTGMQDCGKFRPLGYPCSVRRRWRLPLR